MLRRARAHHRGHGRDRVHATSCSSSTTSRPTTRCAVLQEALPRFPHMRLMPFRRNGGSGTARRIGTHEAYGPHRRLDRRRHDLPERADPGVRPVPARQSRRRPGRRRPDHASRARTSSSGCRPSGSIRKLAERLAATKIPDLNSGLRAFRRDVVPALPAAAAARVLLRHDDHDVVPVQPARGRLPADRLREAGRHVASSTSCKDAYRYILQVLRMVMYFNPIKVLMPLALWLFFIGVVKGVVDVIRYHLRRHHQHAAAAADRAHHRLDRAARRPHRAVPRRDLTRRRPRTLSRTGRAGCGSGSRAPRRRPAR